MPVFSVILTTYDRNEFLQEAVHSVLAQTFTDFELIVVDDGSPTPAVVNSDDSRVRLIREEPNRGISAARNRGTEAATGDYVCFIDDDDWYDPRRLEMVAPFVERAPITLCWFSYRGESTKGRVLNGAVAGEILANTAPSMGATTVRRSKILPFDETYAGAEDIEWWVRMSDYPVVTVPEIGYWVRRHQGIRAAHGSAARLAGSRRMLDQHAAYFRRHPAAAAFRWKRTGMMHSRLGQRSAAVRALTRSFRVQPSMTTLWHLTKSLAR